jgi:hypothetical protein
MRQCNRIPSKQHAVTMAISFHPRPEG